ncbi:MAG: hypothetical protein HY402_01950 [Elusimicrobia bacterium]|nr:hypothetical protein [Elusimicrobiota bacterium]
MSWMPSCREIAELLSHDGLESQPFWRRWMAQIHLGMCALCKRYARQIRLIGEALRRKCRQGPPSEKIESLKQKLLGLFGQSTPRS